MGTVGEEAGGSWFNVVIEVVKQFHDPESFVL